jgi:hypothetical protein
MVVRYTASVAALLWLGVACTPRKTGAQYHVRLLVTNVPGDPLSRVPVSLAGKRIGVTGADGYANLTIVGQEGMRAQLGIQCPPNHRQPTEPVSVGLFDYDTDNTPEVSTICEQERVRQAVIVRTPNAAELPFSLRGQPAGKTDALGVAHVLVEGEPGETVDLLFDTSEYPDLQPANPSVRLVLSNHDDAVLADPRFEVKHVKLKNRRGHGTHKSAAPSAASHNGPVRIH